MDLAYPFCVLRVSSLSSRLQIGRGLGPSRSRQASRLSRSSLPRARGKANPSNLPIDTTNCQIQGKERSRVFFSFSFPSSQSVVLLLTLFCLLFMYIIW